MEGAKQRWGMGGGSRVARLVTNQTCNQGCAFCHRRSTRERKGFVAPAALRRRIESTADADVVVLTGGEPTRRRDLPVIVAACREANMRGARIELETNGALLDAGRLTDLQQAGLDLVRVHLPAWGEDADRITRDPGGFEATLRALRAILELPLQLEFSAPVVRANLPLLPRLPERLQGFLGERLSDVGLVLNVPIESPDPELLCTMAEAAEAIEGMERAARRAGLALRLDSATPIAPCFFQRPARVARLFSLSPGGRTRKGYAQTGACKECALQDRCPGVALRADPNRPSPIREDRIRRRLSVISSERDQITRELFQDEIQRPPGRPARRARTIRVVFACNQSCDFCFVSTHLPAAENERIEAAIVEAAARGDDLCFSGGEPTLRAELEGWIRLAKESGAGTIEVQTNGTRIDRERAERLKGAGADLLFVSLHGSSAEISDEVTSAPGTFVQTLAGLDASRDAGLSLRVNFVFCQRNFADFPAFVALVTERYPAAELCVSFVAPSTDMVPRTEALIPRYSDIQPALREGLALARARGIHVSGFDAMCGLPLCLTPAEAIDPSSLADSPENYDEGEMVRGAACETCSARRKCFGLRRGYAELYGTDELRPITA